MVATPQVGALSKQWYFASDSANDHPGRQISSNECGKQAGFSRASFGLANE